MAALQHCWHCGGELLGWLWLGLLSVCSDRAAVVSKERGRYIVGEDVTLERTLHCWRGRYIVGEDVALLEENVTLLERTLHCWRGRYIVGEDVTLERTEDVTLLERTLHWRGLRTLHC